MPRRGGKNNPKRLPSFPAEIWLHVFQNMKETNGRSAILSLASVNKVLRGIASPVLFDKIRLSSSKPDLDAGSTAYDILEGVIRRIQDIIDLPHVLNAVRQLILVDWWISLPDDDIPDDPPTGLIELRNDACRELVTFIFSLPRLFHLQIRDSSFTPEFLCRLLCVPSLRSLNINRYDIIPSISTPKVAVVSPSLRVFQVDTRYAYGPESEIVELLISIIGQLTVLFLPSSILCRLRAEKGLPTTLPRLQKLSVMFNRDYGAPDNQENFECIHSFLSLTPNLRELRINGDIAIETPFIRLDTTVHNLALSAPSHIANKMVPGLAVETIYITSFINGKLRKEYRVVSPAIKHVTYNGTLNNPEKELLHLAHVFPNATTLIIIKTEGYLNGYQALSEAVLSALPFFKHLRSCRMVASGKGYGDFARLTTYCPIGLAHNPEWRGHPTIEDIQILNFHRWFWSPEKGWYAVHSTDDFDELQPQFFFESCQ